MNPAIAWARGSELATGRSPGRTAALVLAGLLLGACARSPALQAPEAAGDESTRVQADARRVYTALYGGDADTVVALTHARGIEVAGGESEVRSAVGKIGAMAAAGELAVESIEFPSAPEFFAGAENEFVFVPTRSVLRVRGQRMESLNFLVGARRKGEPTWTYLDGAHLDAANIGEFFPDFPKDKAFPVRERKKEP